MESEILPKIIIISIIRNTENEITKNEKENALHQLVSLSLVSKYFFQTIKHTITHITLKYNGMQKLIKYLQSGVNLELSILSPNQIESLVLDGSSNRMYRLFKQLVANPVFLSFFNKDKPLTRVVAPSNLFFQLLIDRGLMPGHVEFDMNLEVADDIESSWCSASSIKSIKFKSFDNGHGEPDCVLEEALDGWFSEKGNLQSLESVSMHGERLPPTFFFSNLSKLPNFSKLGIIGCNYYSREDLVECLGIKLKSLSIELPCDDKEWKLLEYLIQDPQCTIQHIKLINFNPYTFDNIPPIKKHIKSLTLALEDVKKEKDSPITPNITEFIQSMVDNVDIITIQNASEYYLSFKEFSNQLYRLANKKNHPIFIKSLNDWLVEEILELYNNITLI